MNIADRQKPRAGELFLDHVSHFVPDLEAAAGLLERLGFVVTPLSLQISEGKPVGAANRCVMLERGYIELLTPTADTPVAQRMRTRMEKFIGVHLACFGTPDAEAEQHRLCAHGFEAPPVVNLERKVESGDTVRFQVVRVDPAAMPEGRVQYVQQLTPESIWTSKNLGHANGVTGLAALYVCAKDALESAARWARFAGLLPRPDGEMVRLDTARGSVFIGTGERLSEMLRAVPAAPALAGYALECEDPMGFAARCASAGLRVDGNAVMLPASLGGCWLLT